MHKIQVLHLLSGAFTAGAYKKSLILHKSLINLCSLNNLLNKNTKKGIYTIFFNF